MKSIIEEMYNGMLRPLGETNSTGVTDTAKKLIEEEHTIKERFPEYKEVFEKYLEISDEYVNEYAYNQFLNGLKLGAQLMLEIISPLLNNPYLKAS